MNTHVSCADTALAGVSRGGLCHPLQQIWGVASLLCATQVRPLSLATSIPAMPLPLDSHLCADI